VGGTVTRAGHADAASCAEWDGLTWRAMGRGFYVRSGQQGLVGSLVHQGRTLLAAGYFSQIGSEIGESMPASNLARWDVNQWVPFPGTFNSSLEKAIIYEGALVVAGGFTSVDGAPIKFAARWNGSAWESMGEGPDRRILVLAEHQGHLYAGGKFTISAGVLTGPVVRWDGASWTGLGSGPRGVDPWVLGLASTPEGLFVGGNFSTAGLKPSSRIGLWTEGVTPVALLYFRAERAEDTARLSWEIAGEPHDHAGFHVYREAGGSRRERLNDVLLAGERRYVFTDPAPPPEGAAYWLAEVSREGALAWHGPSEIGPVPAGTPALRLSPGTPNPMTSATTIAFSLPRQGAVRLSVYTLQGREVARLVDGVLPGGDHAATWDGRDARGRPAGAGMYLYRLETPWGRRSEKLLRL
jgi:hypothetical protein